MNSQFVNAQFDMSLSEENWELSDTGCDAAWREIGSLREGSIPLRFQGGVAAPLIKRSCSLAAQTGWFVNSNKNKVR